jgi:hypothetical protein
MSSASDASVPADPPALVDTAITSEAEISHPQAGKVNSLRVAPTSDVEDRSGANAAKNPKVVDDAAASVGLTDAGVFLVVAAVAVAEALSKAEAAVDEFVGGIDRTVRVSAFHAVSLVVDAVRQLAQSRVQTSLERNLSAQEPA